MGIVLNLAGQLGDDRRALAVMNAFRGSDHAAAVLLIGGLDVHQELVDAESAFRQVDQVRAVVRKLLAKCCRCGQEAGMSAHDHAQIDPCQCGVVQIGSHEGLRDKSGRRREARGVVVADQVIVDGLWNVDAAQWIVGSPGLLADDPHRV